MMCGLYYELSCLIFENGDDDVFDSIVLETIFSLMIFTYLLN